MENLENNIPESTEDVLEKAEVAAQNMEQKTVFETVAEQEVLSAQETEQPQPAIEKSEDANATEKMPEPKSCGGKKGWKRVLCSVLVAALIAGGCLITAAVLNNRWEKQLEAQKEEFKVMLEESQKGAFGGSDKNNNSTPVESVSGNKTPAQVYAENVGAVVLVDCEYTELQGNQTMTGYSTGSGFIVSDDGYVVTNSHVVDKAESIIITLYDGTEYRGSLVGADAVNDVALLKIDATDLQCVTIGSSTDLIVGDQVVAIGNPLGELTATLTVGYISAKERDVNTEGNTINMLQTDAAINSGNSGGPLLNMNGEVVGITTAKYSGTTGSGAVIEGIGFAIPIDDVFDLLSDLKDFGYVTGAYLGVSVSDMDREAASYYNMPVGAYVHEAVPGYCAAAAGLKEKDIIVALGEYEVDSVSELTRVLRKFTAGETTTITVYRGGKELVLDITLDAKPDAEKPMPEGNYDEWYEYFAPFFGED